MRTMTSRGLGQAFHGAQHYENFPVASWLIPRGLRPSVLQVYRFARTGDDLADEGILTMAARSEGLRFMRQGLWQEPFLEGDLAGMDGISGEHGLLSAGLSPALLYSLGGETGHLFEHHPAGRFWADQLLQAFAYDAGFTPFADWQGVLQYCRKSAAPVGRLLLGLFGLWSDRDGTTQEAARPLGPESGHGAAEGHKDNEEGLAGLTGTEALFTESDAVCMGLQLINFAQDLHQDLSRQRPTLPRNEWPAAWEWQPADASEAAYRKGFLTGDTAHDDRVRITKSLALRGLHQLARGRDLPKRIEATRIPHARRLAIEVAITLEGGNTIGERLLRNPLLGWKESTRLSRLWLAAVLINRLPRMLFKTPL